MQKVTEEEMRKMGLPEPIIEQITTHCVHCDHWKGECTKNTMICRQEVYRDDKDYPRIRTQTTIKFWMAVQKIRAGAKQ